MCHYVKETRGDMYMCVSVWEAVSYLDQLDDGIIPRQEGARDLGREVRKEREVVELRSGTQKVQTYS